MKRYGTKIEIKNVCGRLRGPDRNYVRNGNNHEKRNLEEEGIESNQSQFLA
jgi:hypothetical protein